MLGMPSFSIMNVLGQYQAISGMNRASASIMRTNQNQMNFMGYMSPLNADTVEFSHLAKMDKQNALSNAMNETNYKYYQAWLEALEKAKKNKP